MPAYSFQKQFIPPIMAGTKTHTIRGKRRYPPKPGQPFYGYYAMRTKQCQKLFESPITKVGVILIDGLADLIDPKYFLPTISIDGISLAEDEMEALARRDGFADLYYMMQFWPKEKRPFEGHIIHWKPFVKESDNDGNH